MPEQSSTSATDQPIAVARADACDFDRLTFSDVSRYFGRRRALSHLSCSCDAGEIVGLLGPNGAGKSTLLAMAATTLAASSGEVRYGARTAREIGPGVRGRIGLLTHDLQLYPELTARENLKFFAGLYGLDEPRAHAESALERASLADRADEPVAGFSRGLRQRLALERALLHDPRLVLLDEPFTGLDERSCRSLFERLAALKARQRILLLTTHDFEAADGLLDRAALLWEGRLVAFEPAVGSLREQYRAQMRAGRDEPLGRRA